jgi:hypothetical protein
MKEVTLVFAILLTALGLVGYVGTGSQYPTALIPAWIGLALAVFGILCNSRSEGRRKLFMHINVTVGLLGFIGTTVEIIRSSLSGKTLDPIATASKCLLAGLLLIYVILCVRSFIAARRGGSVVGEGSGA